MNNYNEQNISGEISSQQIVQVTERQERAIRLTQQIITNGNIAADCMVQMGRDLKAVRDERLYTEMGYESFEEYCEKKVGVGKRHGYNFIQVYERFGEQRLTQLQDLGITKLLEIAKLDNEDMEELLQDNDVAQMSVRQVKSKIEAYEKRIEQLTFDLENERGKNSEFAKFTEEAAELESQLEETKALLDAAKRENDLLEQKAHETEQEKQDLEKQINALKNRPVEVAVQEPTAEQMEHFRELGREEERQMQEDRHKEELKALKEKADNERITAVNAARKQAAEMYTAEIEKLKAENTLLQSNSQTVPAPSGGYKEQIRFLLAEISRAFESALGIVDEIEDSEERTKYRSALEHALKKLEESI